MKHTLLKRIITATLIASTFAIYMAPPAQAADPVSAYIASKVLPDMPTINPIKAAGKLLGLVSDSDDAIKKGKKIDKNYKFKATKIVNGTQTFKKSLANTKDNENVILAQKTGHAKLKGATLSKTGNADNEGIALWRGQNAALLVAPYSKATVTNSTLRTNGQGAAALVGSGKGVEIQATGITLRTDGRVSPGLSLAYGATATIKQSAITTHGDLSPALLTGSKTKSEFTGNTISLTTTGVNSPLVSATGLMKLTEVLGEATNSALGSLEGSANVNLTNATLSGAGGFNLYFSDLNTADNGTTQLTLQNSKLTNTGRTPFFTVSNTKGQIKLQQVDLQAPHSDTILDAKAEQWGRNGKNGGQAKLLGTKQTLNGHIKADSASTVEVKLNQGSTLTGAINPNHTAKKASLTLSQDSIWNVTADSYLTELNNEDSTNSNIHTNGYTVQIVK
ncbi:hypothetical protein [Veillonella sp. R32]|uniref:hypothetical protein n=1 Tax=Veillonella sp. R32 TaxID=2021312 RepID=UPI001389FC6D|nr:hypothetical protein [Veillonella sp. R32]KAF1682586.1 hypothetical protein VER_05100 [Veillonella sp. R32]